MILLQMQDGTQAVVQQPAQLAQGGQVIQLAGGGNVQTSATVTQTHQPQQVTATTTTASSTGQASGSGGQNQNIIMMVPGAAGGSPTIQRIPLPGRLLFKTIEWYEFSKWSKKGIIFMNLGSKMTLLLAFFPEIKK